MAEMNTVVPDWLETRISGRSEDFNFITCFWGHALCGQIFGFR